MEIMISAEKEQWNGIIAKRIVERAGLSVVQIRVDGNRAYLISGNGTYVRFDKVKS